MTDDEVERGKRLQAARRESRPLISQAEMGERVGVSEGTIQNYESGKTWDQGTVNLILDVLGKPRDYLDAPMPPTAFSQESTDAFIWRQFSDEVQVAILGVGTWLNKFDGDRLKEERLALIRYMFDRDRV